MGDEPRSWRSVAAGALGAGGWKLKATWPMLPSENRDRAWPTIIRNSPLAVGGQAQPDWLRYRSVPEKADDFGFAFLFVDDADGCGGDFAVSVDQVSDGHAEEGIAFRDAAVRVEEDGVIKPRLI